MEHCSGLAGSTAEDGLVGRRSKADRVLGFVAERRLVRPRDLSAAGLSPAHLQRLFEEGRLLRSGRGIYTLPDASLHEHHSLAEVSLRVPRGVVCLLSALEFHGIGTQSPHQVWLALPPRSHQPALDWPPLRLVQMAPELLVSGVEETVVDGVPVRITSAARTVVDCFRFRNKIGIDIAVEALREGWRSRRFTVDELRRHQVLCRVARVMAPYVEAILE